MQSVGKIDESRVQSMQFPMSALGTMLECAATMDNFKGYICEATVASIDYLTG